MRVQGSRDELGTVRIEIEISDAEVLRAARHRGVLVEKMLDELDGTLVKWTGVEWGLVEVEDEEASGGESEGRDGGEDDEPARTSIEIGDWVYVKCEGGHAVGELIRYSQEEVVVRGKSKQLVDVWPGKIVYVAQHPRPEPDEAEKDAW